MNRLADFVLMYEANIKKAIDDKREDMCLPKTGGGSSGHSFISDPTCQKAMRNIMPIGTVVVEYGAKVAGKCNVKTLHNSELWLEVIDATWKHYQGSKAGAVMRKRYRKGWGMQHIANMLGISAQRCYVILSDVHKYTIESAKTCGAYQERTINHENVNKILSDIKEYDNNKKGETL